MKRKILTVLLAFAMLVSVAFAYSPKTFAVVSTEEENLSGVYYILRILMSTTTLTVEKG